MPTRQPPEPAPRCVSCGAQAHCKGRLPDSNLFAGRMLADVLPGGWLYRCARCRFGFRHPRPAKHELDALYAAGCDEHWSWDAAHRADWGSAARVIATLGDAPARVLDVGCYDGGFLASLPPHIDKHGIEINPGAAAAAQRKGVHIIGDDFAAVKGMTGRYDAVTAFDVLEHIDDPLAWMACFASVLRPGGALIVSTGNLDAWSWTLMGNRYWYCAIPEHISFLSLGWFHYAGRALGLTLASTWRFAHAPMRLARRVYETTANLAYLVAPSAIGALRRRGFGNVSAKLAPALAGDYPPGWASARDHVLVTLRAP